MPNVGIIVPWSVAGILFVVLLIIFLNPEKTQIWGSWIQGWFASAHSFFDRNAIAGKIQGTINQFAKGLEKEAEGIIPYTVKIDWVKDLDREAFLKEDGTVVVPLGYSHGRRERSLALAMAAFCTKGLIPFARPYLGDTLLRAVDLVTTKKMLSSAKTRGSVDYFLGDMFEPEIERDENLKEQCQTMETLDRQGLFTRVLLKELAEFGRKLYPDTPDGSTVLEGDDFVSFIKQIAEKDPDEDVELSFTQRRIRVSVMLVARRKVIQEHGFPLYLKKIQQDRKKDVETTYLCGRGQNIRPTIKIANIAEKEGLGTVVSSTNHKVIGIAENTISAVCIALQLTSPDTGS